MSSLSTYTHKRQLDYTFGSGTPATLYFARFTVAPTIAGTGGTEVVGGTYARAAVLNNVANWPAAVDVGAVSKKTLANRVSFVQSTTDEGITVAVGIYDAPTGGNFLGFAPVTAQAVPIGIVFSIEAGTEITLAAAA